MQCEQAEALPIMQIVRTDSTSALAWRKLQQGQALPFAVLAAEQSEGRGQAGRRWHSPRGNLYLSLAVQPHLRQGLSLLVAALVCEWLSERGIVASCKWPNDILYHGKKLGGVLCTGARQGGQWRYVIVGIGLNVNVVPAALRDEATSMQAICGQEGDVVTYGKQLARHCVTALHTVKGEEEALARQARFSAAAAELWCRGEEFFVRQPHPQGHLRLLSLQTGMVAELVSSSPDYRLVYQQPYRYPLVVADIGNSALKLVLFRDNEVECQATAQPTTASIASALHKLRHVLDYADKWVIYAVAVNHHHLALLRDVAERHGFIVLTLAHKAMRLHTAYDIAQLGTDRLAALEAALVAYGDENVVLVNFGTATTIDVLAQGYHRGGYILPGLATSLQALADYSELPRLTCNLLQQAPASLGTCTATAITAGVLHSQVAYVRDIGARVGTHTLLISGGLGQYAMPYLGTATYEPLLVAQGIRVLLLR